MPVLRPPNFKPPVEHLFKLVESELSPEEFKAACMQFSHFDSDTIEDSLWEFYFHKDLDAELQVSLLCEPTNKKNNSKKTKPKPIAVVCAILPFCWWDNGETSDQFTEDTYSAELAEFDLVYAQALQATKDVLGQPGYEGSDRIAPFNKHTIWRGKAGLLILQQSRNDPSPGYIINYWIQPWNKDELQPSDPFIEWLENEALTPPGVPLPGSWALCDPGMENELNKELAFNFFHPLKGIRAISVARSAATDDVLFEIFGHKHKFAMVHLTWTREWNPNWPETSFYDSWKEWAQSVKRYSED